MYRYNIISDQSSRRPYFDELCHLYQFISLNKIFYVIIRCQEELKGLTFLISDQVNSIRCNSKPFFSFVKMVCGCWEICRS